MQRPIYRRASMTRYSAVADDAEQRRRTQEAFEALPLPLQNLLLDLAPVIVARWPYDNAPQAQNPDECRDESRPPIRLLTIDEAAHALKVSKSTVKELLRTRRIVSVHIGRRTLISHEALRAFLASVES